MYNQNLEIKGCSTFDLEENKEEKEVSVLERQAGYNLVDKTISQAKVLKEYMRGNCNSRRRSD